MDSLENHHKALRDETLFRYSSCSPSDFKQPCMFLLSTHSNLNYHRHYDRSTVALHQCQGQASDLLSRTPVSVRLQLLLSPSYYLFHYF